MAVCKSAILPILLLSAFITTALSETEAPAITTTVGGAKTETTTAKGEEHMQKDQEDPGQEEHKDTAAQDNANPEEPNSEHDVKDEIKPTRLPVTTVTNLPPLNRNKNEPTPEVPPKPEQESTTAKTTPKEEVKPPVVHPTQGDPPKPTMIGKDDQHAHTHSMKATATKCGLVSTVLLSLGVILPVFVRL